MIAHAAQLDRPAIDQREADRLLKLALKCAGDAWPVALLDLMTTEQIQLVRVVGETYPPGALMFTAAFLHIVAGTIKIQPEPPKDSSDGNNKPSRQLVGFRRGALLR